MKDMNRARGRDFGVYKVVEITYFVPLLDILGITCKFSETKTFVFQLICVIL